EINGFRIIVPPEPQMTCALGAALVARDDYYSEK
ncbi:MAG: 2-hydroxyglutaryl-CoA dehydratase, partial [Deltaproteobacteria bacterium]|nr:2-hydroxyglutaryl-CoA dehydratase [Deltaproteobacteria bacterium]